MFNRKGEISTLVILGTLVVIGVATLMSSTVNNQRQVVDTRAAVPSCNNNPVPPPDGGYTWVANCTSSCTTNADCPQNTSDPNINPQTSNWCYGFAEGAKCLQLQRGSGSSVPPVSGSQTGGTSNSGIGAVCNNPQGCGGACNISLNNGCGYGGCRAWEACVNNTCIDTTNLGTQPAGPNACHDRASANAPENNPGSSSTGGTNPNPVPPTSIPPQGTNPTSPSTGTNTDPRPTSNPTVPPTRNTPVQNTPSPTPRTCGIGQKWCPEINKCSLEFIPCPTPTVKKTRNTNTNTDAPSRPTPTSSRVKVTLGVPPNTPTPGRVQVTLGVPPNTSNSLRESGNTNSGKRIKIYQTIESRVCTGNVNIDNGCVDLYGYYSL